MHRSAALAILAVTISCAQAPADAVAAHADPLKAAAGNCGGGNCGGNAMAAASAPVKVPIDGSPVLGDAAAPCTLVEFTDYECPFCSRAHATVEKLVAEYGGKLRVVMKQNPLPMHPHAPAAARAALAAGLQGKFWEMHRALFANARSLDQVGIDAAATAAGIDPGLLRASLGDPRIDAALQRDQALARTAGAAGTPTFFVNGRRLAGAQPIEQFRALIDEELGRAEQLIKTGVKPADLYERLQQTAPAAAPPEPRGPAPIAAASDREKVEAGNSPNRGAANAKVTLVIFSDFQCPFCARAANTVHAIGQRFGDRVRIAFRNQPLPMHKDARLAAAAALAAHEQGKFWQFHDALFAHQQELDRRGLERRAEELGLDMARFRESLDRGTSDAAIADDEAEARRLGVTGTPTMFVNGRRIIGAQPIEAIAAVIDEELRIR